MWSPSRNQNSVLLYVLTHILTPISISRNWSRGDHMTKFQSWELLGIEFLGRVDLIYFFLFHIEDRYTLITITKINLTDLIKKQVHTLSSILTYKLLDENKYTMCSHFIQRNYLTKQEHSLFPSPSYKMLYENKYSLCPLLWCRLVDENKYTLHSHSHHRN